jgi:hypothetical protein
MSIRSLKSGLIGTSLLVGNQAFEPTSFDSIATVTVGSGGSATISFTSIPSTYKHLQLRISAQTNRGTFGSDYSSITFNGDTGSNYNGHTLGGDGDTPIIGSGVNTTSIGGGATGTTTGGTFSGTIIDILDYANTNKFKSTKTLSANDFNGKISGYGGEIYLLSGIWRSTSAISSITINRNSGSLYSQNSIFALYGIASS